MHDDARPATALAPHPPRAPRRPRRRGGLPVRHLPGRPPRPGARCSGSRPRSPRPSTLFEQRGWIDDPASYHQDAAAARRRAHEAGPVGQPAVHEPVVARRLRAPARGARGRPVRSSYRVEPGRPRHAARAPLAGPAVAGLPARLRHGSARRSTSARSGPSTSTASSASTSPSSRCRSTAAGTRARRCRPPMPSADVLDTVHGLTQAVWDVRQLLAHLRARTDQPIGLMGLSLGGLVAATVASIDEPHAVAAARPRGGPADAHGRRRRPRRLRRRAPTPSCSRRASRCSRRSRRCGSTPKVPIERQLIVAGHARPLRPPDRPGHRAVAPLGRAGAALVPRRPRVAVLGPGRAGRDRPPAHRGRPGRLNR